MIDKVLVMNRARKKYCQQHEMMIREKAERSFLQYKNSGLFIAGIMLYWAEGMMSNAARGSQYALSLSSRDARIAIETWIDCFCKQNLNKSIRMRE